MAQYRTLEEMEEELEELSGELRINRLRYEGKIENLTEECDTLKEQLLMMSKQLVTHLELSERQAEEIRFYTLNGCKFSQERKQLEGEIQTLTRKNKELHCVLRNMTVSYYNIASELIDFYSEKGKKEGNV